MFLFVSIVLLLGTYILVNKIVIENTQILSKSYAEQFVLYCETVAEHSNEKISEEFFDGICEKATEMCDAYYIDYIYVFVPDIQNDKIKYLLLTGKEDVESKASGEEKNPVHEYHLTDELLAVWNGEIEVAYTTTDNRYGYELNTIVRVEDEFGGAALVGLDTSMKALTSEVIYDFIILAIIFLGLFLIISVMLYLIIRNRVSKPANKICTVLENYISDGARNNNRLEVEGNDEFARISKAFNTMSDEIDKYINDIKLLVKEQERQKSEMVIASKIQKGFLQNGAYKNDNYEINAIMRPAKNVGGDFYDYIPLDEDNVLVTIADVSGKGITASLMMCVTITLIRQLSKMGQSSSEILHNVNNLLAGNNPEFLFVTAFIGIYNHSTKTLTYSNAGHNPPYVLGSDIIPLNKKGGVPLGLFGGEMYEETSLKLTKGDILFLFTDGVNEAVSVDGGFYTTGRLEQELRAFKQKGNGNLVDYINQSVLSFSENAEQSDDVTMLSLEV